MPDDLVHVAVPWDLGNALCGAKDPRTLMHPDTARLIDKMVPNDSLCEKCKAHRLYKYRK